VSLLDGALDAGAAGWHVHPCHPRTKAPLLPHGHHDASADPDVIRGWWERWPNAMIGAAVPDPFIAIDIDPRNGGSYEALEEAAGPLPETLTVWSGRNDGGRHLYFARPAGPLTSTRLPEGVDLKASGYLIIPPSLHPATGEPYRWQLREVARLTPRLREILRPAPPPRYKPSGGGNGAPLVRLVLALGDGERNRGLYWAACRAAEQGILGSIEADLLAAVTSRGLPEYEARRTIASAARTVTR
jgi:hypothetical protein